MENSKEQNVRIYFASSLFSIISVLQIQLVYKKNALLILENEIPNVLFLSQKLQELGIFKKVLIVNCKNLGSLKYFIRGKAPEGTSLVKSLSQTINNWYVSFLRNISYKKFLFYFIPENLLENVSELFMCGASHQCIALVDYLIDNRKIKEINLVEEGMRDYCTDSYIKKIRKNIKSNDIHINLYLNMANLTLLKDKVPNVSFIQIKNESIAKLEEISSIFTQGKQELEENEYIYFDQMIEDITRYQKWGTIKKFFLKNSLKKAQQEIKAYPRRIKIIRDLIEISKEYGLNLKIRLHPRCKSYNNYKGVPKDLFFSKIEDKFNIPWEFILLANKNKKIFLISNFSTSVVSSILLYKNSFNGILVYTYKIVEDTSCNDILIIEKLQKQFPDIIKIPNNLQELKDILTRKLY